MSLDWCSERSILTSSDDRASSINNSLLKSFDGQELTYKSIDSVTVLKVAVLLPVEFLNKQNPPGFPLHNLILKIGASLVMLRNLNPPLNKIALQKSVIEAIFFTGCANGKKLFLPNIFHLTSKMTYISRKSLFCNYNK